MKHDFIYGSIRQIERSKNSVSVFFFNDAFGVEGLVKEARASSMVLGLLDRFFAHVAYFGMP